MKGAPTLFRQIFASDCILSKGIELSELLEMKKQAILYFQPCASEKGKLMADVELRKEEVGSGPFLDPTVLCSLLEIHRRRFSAVKCSPNLGVAKLTWKGRDISIFKNGKIKIQRALNRSEITKIACSVSRLIWGAVNCDVCGMPALRCASGECRKCMTEEKSAVALDDLPNAALLTEGYSNLSKALEKISPEERLPAPPEELEKLLRDAQYLGLFFTMEAPHKENAVLGLALLGEVERVRNRYGSSKSAQ